MSSEIDETFRTIKGRINYILENCQIAYRELCAINDKLRKAMESNSPENPQLYGDLNRMIQDYLIIRVASLFDKDSRTVSFANLFEGNTKYESIRREQIIKDMIKNRHEWAAHNDRNGQMMFTSTICQSNLGEILTEMKGMIV